MQESYEECSRCWIVWHGSRIWFLCSNQKHPHPIPASECITNYLYWFKVSLWMPSYTCYLNLWQSHQGLLEPTGAESCLHCLYQVITCITSDTRPILCSSSSISSVHRHRFLWSVVSQIGCLFNGVDDWQQIRSLDYEAQFFQNFRKPNNDETIAMNRTVVI